ncbi:MAG: InlB B-repeat-containing protein [Candidatus Promineofilum sp.]|uniref:InlB B-repeat-containing protein n=1 Tax=Promineifilum sp. TaxID=2664178 RepID=UPI002411FDB5|nr:InlB B-repeat-containing protein [Promineifilum sp.]MCO5179002.1 InlB B-repeat-containing protein [Promineifilum sp.]
MNGNLKLRSILILCVLALLTAMLSAVHPLAAEANAFSLTLNVSPPGSGTATANPGPPYSQNQTVTLTATANPGYVFDHWVSSADAKWWDAGWDYRVEVTAAAAGYARKNKPAEFDVNFTQLWTSLGTSGTLDPNSIRVVEVDGDDNVIDADVPFQFDKATDYNAATKAAGKVVVIMVGNTGAGATRTYHIYFDVTGKGFAAPNVTPQVVLSEVSDESVAAYKLQTATGNLYIHKSSGGVSSYNDLNGNDWVSWNSSAGSSGSDRGIPNAAGGSNEAIFHPGKGKMTPTVLSQGPIKVTLHFLGKKLPGDTQRWEGTFEIYPNYTTFTMVKARISGALSYPFWFLYEGTPGGQLNTATDYIVFSDGTQVTGGQTRNGDLPNEEWAYVVDPAVGAAGRAIYFVNHKDDTANDTYFPGASNQMTVLGFGRSGSSLLMPNNSAPRRLTFGLTDEVAPDDAKPVLYNAYRDLNVNVGSAEARAGSSLGTQNPVQFTITGEHAITAIFKQSQTNYTVTTSASPPEGGSVTLNPPGGTYAAGTQVIVTPLPNPGYTFSGWSGDESGNANPLTITVTKNMNITALFAVPSFTVTTSANPPEGGSVTLNPPGGSYPAGTTVTVSATANNGYTFTEWTGDLGGNAPSQDVLVDEDLTIVANFAQPQFTFNATSAGNGTVDWTPKKNFYAAGEAIMVEAMADPGFAFSDWTGTISSTVNPLSFTISQDTTLVANFVAAQTYTIDVTVPGGGGTVTRDKPGPNYPLDTVVTLTAVPDAGKRFVSWSGDATGTNPVIQVTVNRNFVITATFADDGFPLNITLLPPEGGNVTKQPDQAFYLPGTMVTLTAFPNPGWSFVGWSGDASGTNSTTTVIIGDDGANVTAAFTAPGPFTLTTGTTGNGSGTVKVSPLKTEYLYGEVVKLTAEPAGGSIFAGWTGDLTSNSNPVNVTMLSDKNIVATFIVPAGPYTDQFDTCALDAKWGQPNNPLGDGTFKVNGTHLLITVPEGPTHNVWSDGNNAPRVMQAADNVDFEYVVKFDSAVTQTAQMQGIIVEQDAQNFARFDFEYNEGLKIYAATFADGAARKRISLDINPPGASYLRVSRVGVRWFVAYSTNGTDWTEAGTFNNYVLNVKKAGVFAGNVASKGNPAPAHTAVVDYFYNTAQGSLPADRPLLDITVVGTGSVSTNPPLSQLACGQTVTLTAVPGFNATFDGWSGDATGTQAAVSLLLSGPKKVTATFVGSKTQYLLLPLVISQN